MTAGARSSATHRIRRARIAEIGEILALGLVRLKARQSTQLSPPDGESSLASLGHQSGHANPQTENGR